MTTNTQHLTPTDAEIVELADATRTAEGGANGYILPISFCRAVLAKWGTLRADSIVIPTDTMEQEFQKHYQRGYAAGQKASATQPTQEQAVQGVQWQCGPQASGFTAPQADSQPAPQPLPASQGDALSQAASDVLAERQRQISAEGRTQSHDDLEHEPGQLSSAAACYALNASEWLTRPYVSRADYATLSFIDLSNWPWDGSWWKPKNERGDLVRAGALIIAELERMDRADAARTAQEGK